MELMMARKKGSLTLSSNIEVKAAAPLDARLTVPSVTDLIDASNFPYAYVGMVVSVQDTGKIYTLIANDTTVGDNWQEIGGGSSDPNDLRLADDDDIDKLFYNY